MKLDQKYPRSSGVLLSVTMLSSPFGIGVLGNEAMDFISFLCESGFHAWQVLPIEQTGAGFSPYNCISAFAGEPMLIDPRMLYDMKLITFEELSGRSIGLSADFVDYEHVRDIQWKILKAAFSRLKDKPYADFDPFWLDEYALYMALKQHFDNEPWYDWPDVALRSHEPDALKQARADLSREIDFNKFVQWVFSEQWRKLKEFAAKKNISIIGDMPFYVSADSVEVWSRRELFDADSDGHFRAVGGAPPDAFTPDGQLWGNPVYNWNLMKKEGYEWWIKRVESALERYDIIRFDHFRGFESYWRIPADALTARGGKWAKGPGRSLFKVMKQALGELPVIAEDLGDIDEDVENLLKATGFRGMRVLQFGFMGDELHLPHNFTEDCVAYTGTHDNTPLLAWMFELAPGDREQALFYLGFSGNWSAGGPNCAINEAWVRALFTSGASLVVIPIQDMLGYGSDTRTNIPGTPEGNWRFRVHPDAIRQIDAEFYAELNRVSCRDNAACGAAAPQV